MTDHRVRELERQVADLRKALVGDDAAWWRLSSRLTKTEEIIVRTLYGRQGMVTKSTLYSAIYSDRVDPPDPSILGVLMCLVRKKLPKGSIDTVPGRGWMITSTGRRWVDRVMRGGK